MADKQYSAIIMTRIEGILGRKAVAAYALCKEWAKRAEYAAKTKQGTTQGQGHYWTNQTSEAVKGIRGYAVRTDEFVGFGLMHTVRDIKTGEAYGKWLELCEEKGKGKWNDPEREYKPRKRKSKSDSGLVNKRINESKSESNNEFRKNELGKNRNNAILEPTIREIAPSFHEALRKLYAQ